MTPKEIQDLTKERAPWTEAQARGEVVEFRRGQNPWAATYCPALAYDEGIEFRLKPKPLECWLLVAEPAMNADLFWTEEAAKRVAVFGNRRIVRMVEAPEEAK